jgi:hypothetical protein
MTKVINISDNNEDKNKPAPERVYLKDGLKFTITAAVCNASTFNHYVLKEYAPKVQGALALSKSPAKHTLENCLYDEIAGWLDSPSITGIAILDVQVDNFAYKNKTLNPDPKVSFSDIVNLLYNVCQLGMQDRNKSPSCNVDEEQLEDVREKAKYILQHLDKAVTDEATKEPISKVGSGLRQGALPRELPKTS